jgi:hypothetical protein
MPDAAVRFYPEEAAYIARAYSFQLNIRADAARQR